VASYRKPLVAAEVAPTAPATSDEFDLALLGRQWQWHANHDPAWADLTSRPGWLRLAAGPVPGNDLHLAPHFLGQKFPARTFAVETILDAATLTTGTTAGLAVLGGGTHAFVGARRGVDGVELVQIVSGNEHRLGKTTAGRIRLRVTVAPDGSCTFAWAADCAFVAAPVPFTAVAGGWIGAKTGLLAWSASAGTADFDHFRIT
jgi:hypothetical protein